MALQQTFNHMQIYIFLYSDCGFLDSRVKHKSSTVYAAGSAVAQSGREGRTRLNTHRPGENEDNRQRERVI